MIVLIIGKPGSGKGTQAKTLAKKFDLFYFSTGDLSRDLAKKDPRIDEMIHKKGKWIPEKEMTGYVSDYLDKKLTETKDLILDGYPRFALQYGFLKDYLESKNLKIDLIILLKISDEEAVRRLSSRREDKNTGKVYNLVTNPPGSEVNKGDLVQRKDDIPEAIRSRLKEHEKNALPMIKKMREDGFLVEIGGERPIEEIQDDLVTLLNKVNDK